MYFSCYVVHQGNLSLTFWEIGFVLLAFGEVRRAPIELESLIYKMKVVKLFTMLEVICVNRSIIINII